MNLIKYFSLFDFLNDFKTKVLSKKINFILCFIFLFSLSLLSAQSGSRLLKENLEKAKHYENKSDCASAINLYYNVAQDSSDLGHVAEEQAKNLLPKCREIIFSQLQGKWQLKKKWDSDDDSNITFTKFIEIKDNTILFYNETRKTVSEINLQSNPFGYHLIAGFPSLQLGNEIWTFSTRTVNSEKRLRLRKYTDKNGNLMSKIDDRAAIVNEKERTQALAQEIDTYYVKKNSN